MCEVGKFDAAWSVSDGLVKINLLVSLSLSHPLSVPLPHVTELVDGGEGERQLQNIRDMKTKDIRSVCLAVDVEIQKSSSISVQSCKIRVWM